MPRRAALLIELSLCATLPVARPLPLPVVRPLALLLLLTRFSLPPRRLLLRLRLLPCLAVRRPPGTGCMIPRLPTALAPVTPVPAPVRCLLLRYPVLCGIITR